MFIVSAISSAHGIYWVFWHFSDVESAGFVVANETIDGGLWNTRASPQLLPLLNPALKKYVLTGLLVWCFPLDAEHFHT
jgi:hypothetical protein